MSFDLPLCDVREVLQLPAGCLERSIYCRLNNFVVALLLRFVGDCDIGRGCPYPLKVRHGGVLLE